MKRLFRFRYPKLLLLIVLCFLSYFIFKNPDVNSFIKSLNELSYLGIFIAGLFFSFGFSTPFAVGFFLTTHPPNIFLAALIGGVGALISDMLIFKLIRFSFMDEFTRLEKTKTMRELSHLISTRHFHKAKNYFLYLFAGIIIASPLPDEVGVSMLAGLTHIKTYLLGIISFIMNTLGILIMLYIAL